LKFVYPQLSEVGYQTRACSVLTTVVTIVARKRDTQAGSLVREFP
jgi:hypothetical protein